MDTATPSAAELRAFYEHYIGAFNARDRVAFVDCFDLPVTVMRPSAGDDGTVSVSTVADPDALWPTLPARWTHSTIDDVRAIGADSFAVRPGFVPATGSRVALDVTVTRWAGDVPYEQYHVLYLLTVAGGRPRISAMLPLAAAHPS